MATFITRLRSPRFSRVELGCLLGVILAVVSLGLSASTRNKLGKVEVVVCGQSTSRLDAKQVKDLKALCGSRILAIALPGPTGSAGPTGASGGSAGAPRLGRPGADGKDGADGVSVQGLPGPTGPAGPIGHRGKTGSRGAHGLKGDKGEKGEPGPLPSVSQIAPVVTQIVNQVAPGIVRDLICSLAPVLCR